MVGLFNPDVQVYETHNRGPRYIFGFFLVAAAVFGSGQAS
jgi:hypothetical protein